VGLCDTDKSRCSLSFFPSRSLSIRLSSFLSVPLPAAAVVLRSWPALTLPLGPSFVPFLSGGRPGVGCVKWATETHAVCSHKHLSGTSSRLYFIQLPWIVIPPWPNRIEETQPMLPTASRLAHGNLTRGMEIDYHLLLQEPLTNRQD